MLDLVVSLWWLWLILLTIIGIVATTIVVARKKATAAVGKTSITTVNWPHRLFSLFLVVVLIVSMWRIVVWSLDQIRSDTLGLNVFLGSVIFVVSFVLFFQWIKNKGTTPSDDKPGIFSNLKKYRNYKIMWFVYISLIWWTLIMLAWMLSEKYPPVWAWLWGENKILVILTAPIASLVIIVNDIKETPRGVRFFVKILAVGLIAAWSYPLLESVGAKIESYVASQQGRAPETQSATVPNEPIFATLTARPGTPTSPVTVDFPFRIRYSGGPVRVRVNGTTEYTDGPGYRIELKELVRTLEFTSLTGGDVTVTITRRAQ